MRDYHGKCDLAIPELQIKMNYYTYNSLLNKANNLYRTILDLKQWGPHVTSKDKGAVPETLIIVSEANALVQRAMAKFKKGNLDDIYGKGKNNFRAIKGIQGILLKMILYVSNVV
jgi:hypothetical protein